MAVNKRYIFRSSLSDLCEKATEVSSKEREDLTNIGCFDAELTVYKTKQVYSFYSLLLEKFDNEN